MREAGLRKLVVWHKDFWTLEHYRAFGAHLDAQCSLIATTPEIRIYDISGDG